MLPDASHRMNVMGLSGNPEVLSRLVSDLPADSPVWDLRPDSKRFTLREMAAHLADFEPIFRGRMISIRDQEQASLNSVDEGQLAITNDYAHADPAETLQRWTRERAETITFLKSVSGETWGKSGLHQQIGPVSIESIAVMVNGHDCYHLQQAAQWLREAGV